MNDKGADKSLKVQGEASNNGVSHNKIFSNKVDTMEVQCYYCQKFNRYARYCYFNKETNVSDKEETQFAHARNSDY